MISPHRADSHESHLKLRPLGGFLLISVFQGHPKGALVQNFSSNLLSWPPSYTKNRSFPPLPAGLREWSMRPKVRERHQYNRGRWWGSGTWATCAVWTCPTSAQKVPLLSCNNLPNLMSWLGLTASRLLCAVLAPWPIRGPVDRCSVSIRGQ